MSLPEGNAPLNPQEMIAFLSQAGRSRRVFRTVGSSNSSFETTEATFNRSFQQVSAFFGGIMADEPTSKADHGA